MALRHVADQWISPSCVCVEYLDVADKRLLQSEEQAKQCCLPGTIGTDYCYELATIDVESSVLPDRFARIASRYVSNRDYVGERLIH